MSNQTNDDYVATVGFRNINLIVLVSFYQDEIFWAYYSLFCSTGGYKDSFLIFNHIQGPFIGFPGFRVFCSLFSVESNTSRYLHAF